MKNADFAMYQAKDAGRNNYQFFKTEMNVRAIERLSVENALRHALERHEFELYYQPKVNLDKTLRLNILFNPIYNGSLPRWLILT